MEAGKFHSWIWRDRGEKVLPKSEWKKYNLKRWLRFSLKIKMVSIEDPALKVELKVWGRKKLVLKNSIRSDSLKENKFWRLPSIILKNTSTHPSNRCYKKHPR